MLRMLGKKEITARWDFIKIAIEKSLPIIASSLSDHMEYVYSNLLLGTMQCWVSYKDVEREDTISCVGTTTFIYDLCTNGKMLLGYSIYSLGSGVTDKELEEGYPVLLKFAKDNKCERFCAYTDVMRVAEMAKLLGATGTIFLTSPPLMDNSSEEKQED